MEKNIIAIASIILANTLIASPSATQSWVRNYVATNTQMFSESRTISDSINVGGTNYAFSMTMSTANEPAWHVVSSSVAGLTNGLDFAIDRFGNACNYTNVSCTVIYQSADTNWMWAVNGKTNNVTVARLDFQVGGVWYRGYEDLRNGTVTAAGVSNETGIVVFKRWFVTSLVKQKLTTQPRVARLSLFDLFVGSAYADWYLDEDWKLATKEEAGHENPWMDEEGAKHYLWVTHYRWDGANGSIEIPSLTGKFSNGATYTFEINYSSGDLVGEMEYCEFMKAYNSDAFTSEILSEIIDVLKGAVEEKNPVAKEIFARMLNTVSFKSQIEGYVKSVINNIFVSKDCPQWSETTEDAAPVENPKPNSYDPDCPHANAICVSSSYKCSFQCVACNTNLYSGTHHFADSSKHCAVCDYKFRGKDKYKCGFASDQREHHHFSTAYGGMEEGCYCQHHHCWTPHQSLHTDTSFWKYDNDNHWHTNYCTTCGWGGGVANRSGHYNTFSVVFKNDEMHTRSNYCYTCKRVDSKTDENHVSVTSSPFWHEDNGDGTHAVCWKCKSHPTGCGEMYSTNNAPHNVDWSTGVLAKNTIPPSGHHTNATCRSIGCAAEVESGSVPHDLEWILSSSWMLTDSKKCECGYATNNIPHAVSCSEIVHWCANGGNHLMGVHQWGSSDTNLCTVCGYRRGTVPTEDTQTLRTNCECGSCYIIKSRTRKDAQSPWGAWSVTTEHCAYGWDFQSNKCGCPMCALGYYDSCVCEHPTPTWWSWVSPNLPYGPSTLPFSGSNN